MRQPRNSLNKDTAEKPYNSENFDIMRKTTTNKQIEDIGGVTKHSEFEKPYKLNWNEDYSNMQNLHPSNYDFSFLDTSSPNFENNIPNIPSGGIGGIDPCIGLLSACQSEGMFGTACGKAMAAGCLKVIGNCMQFNWTGGTSYEEAECFCEGFGGDINQQYNENCVKEFCQTENCSPFTLEGSDTAPTTLQISGSAACIKSVTGGQWSEGSSSISVPDEGCGTKNVCATDICGNTVCKSVKMSDGVWSQLSYWYFGGHCEYLPGLYLTSCTAYHTCSKETPLIKKDYLLCWAWYGAYSPPFYDDCRYKTYPECEDTGYYGGNAIITETIYEWTCP